MMAIRKAIKDSANLSIVEGRRDGKKWKPSQRHPKQLQYNMVLH
jgi:hypothetical protein